ncbi:hypothetical protein PVW51_01935 [Sulfitobacter sp. PR48]|uniref:MotE family protein n=1 Tax=Sulfitobacter sp. PR48 TaxID=3028383 RepID=UPI00237C3555|nr:hypothetical protein [Sulfitobacter sp. PR48]MDD9719429.1 hypothetical protein [Sulfitobacter sp. PR48]
MKLKRKAKPDLKRNGRGTVMIIAALLSASAILRLGSGAGSAVAEAVSAPARAVEEEVLADPPVDEPGQIDRVEMGRLLSALRDREARIAQREEKIAMRSKALSVADSEIEKRMAALAQMEENLRQTLALADGAAEKDLSRLTAVYENMKPKDAATLFEAMEPDFAAGFLGRMRPDAAASVLAGLSPEAAYSISVILAGRNATAPKS